MGKIRTIISKFVWICEKRKLHNSGCKGYVDIDHIISKPQYIEIGDGFVAGKDLKIQAWDHYRDYKIKYEPRIIIGDKVSIMDHCHISCTKKVTIGNGCLLGDNVFITDNFHGMDPEGATIPPIERELKSKGPVTIGENVWIGRNACIMPGVTIGDGAIIGANAVVTKNVEKGTIAGGVPARQI